MSVQSFRGWIFVFIVSFLSTAKIFSEQQLFGAQSIIGQEFYELLAEINEDSSAAQIVKLEAFVRNHPAFAPSATWLFERYITSGDFRLAKHFFTSLPDSGLSLLTKNWMLGKVHARQEHSQEAMQAFTIALMVTSPSPELVLDFVFFDSRSLRKLDDPDFLATLALDDEALAVMNALWYYAEGEWQLAIDKFSVLPRHLRDNLTIMYSWGFCLNRSAQSERTREKWQKGLETARALGDLRFEAKFFSNLGLVAETLEATLSYYDSTYSIAKQIGDLKRLESLAGNWGNLYSQQGHFSLADSFYREAIDAGQRLRSPWRMSVWYPRLGNLLVQQDRFDEALQAYDEGANLARKAGNTERLIRCQIREGGLYRVLGQYELARRILTDAYEEAKDRGEPRLEIQAHTELAYLDFAIGHYAEAREVYNLYLNTSATTRYDLQDHAWWRIQVGRTYLAEKNCTNARTQFKGAYILADSTATNFYTALSLLYLAEIDLLESELEYVHELLDECLTLAEETELHQVLPAIYSLRGDAYQKVGELEKALRQYKKAANLVEQTRENLASEASKLDYFGDKSDIYDKLVACYRGIYETTGNPAYQDSLYLYMEMKRGRTLRELRAGNGTKQGDVEANFRRDKLLQAAKRLQSQQRYLRDYGALLTKQEMDSVMAQVQTARLSLIAQRLRLTQGTNIDSGSLLAKIPSLEKLGAILRTNESALIFYHFSEFPFALVITGDTTRVVSLPTTITSLDSLIQSLLNPFHRVREDAAEAVFKAGLAHELYLSLVEPIEEAVKLPANLVIAPDAHLANLPFELLLFEKPERGEYTIMDPPNYSDDFLIQRYSIGYVPNASFLIQTDFVPASPSLLVFADPVDNAPLIDERKFTSLRTGLNFDPLIFASDEADSIKAIYSNTEILRMEDATKERLFQEAPKYDIVHFATHAFVDTTHDAFSGLVLSTGDDREDDGILMGYEIADMNLQADLVTLSACETGRGKVMPGEGVLGLPRLFLGAGANTVLMTHWKVDDKFAVDLMVDFYDHYLKQGLPKVSALAAAKRCVLNSPQKSGEVNYHHPFYWAAFAMYGEPGFVRQSRLTVHLIVLIVLLVFAVVGMMYYLKSIREKKLMDCV